MTARLYSILAFRKFRQMGEGRKDSVRVARHVATEMWQDGELAATQFVANGQALAVVNTVPVPVEPNPLSREVAEFIAEVRAEQDSVKRGRLVAKLFASKTWNSFTRDLQDEIIRALNDRR
jgi:hypothetical protein